MTTARDLLVRRLLLEQGGNRRKVVAPRAVPPMLLAERYAAEMRRQISYLEHALLQHLSSLVPERRDATREEIVGQVLEQITVLYRRHVGTVATATGIDTSQHNRRQLDVQWQSVLGVDYPETGDPVRGRLESFRDENVDLITRMTGEQLDIIKAELRRLGPGARIEDIRSFLMQRMSVTRSRASLIARDQVLKLNSQLTQIRHEEAGVEEYEWSSSNDERVRHTKTQNHRILNLTRHRWDAPPVVNLANGDRAHPGTYYQCRCCANPVFDLKAMGVAAIKSPHQSVFFRR